MSALAEIKEYFTDCSPPGPWERRIGFTAMAVNVTIAVLCAMNMDPVAKNDSAEPGLVHRGAAENAVPGFGSFEFTSQELGRLSVNFSVPRGYKN